MRGYLMLIDETLRGNRPDISDGGSRRLMRQGIIMLVFIMIYGGVMGSMGLFAPGSRLDREWLQVLYSAIKVPLFLTATFLLSLPIFFVLNTLAGLRGDFMRVISALTETQAGLSIILGGLAPLTLLWYMSNGDYPTGILFNGLMFAVATIGAQLRIRENYRQLIERDAMHGRLIKLWGLLYVFVGIQMGWVLRPFIGSPGSAVHFLRGDEMGNAYVTLAEIIWNVITR
ncbi:MAG: hypothetical protein ABIR47_15375 [Candidatus Kapaibacterium sp.]